MADEDLDDIKSWFQGISKNSSLELLLPTSPDVDPSTTSLVDSNNTDPFSNIATRKTLFFDEQVNVLVFLSTSGDSSVRKHSSKLELRIAAHATEANPQGNTASTSSKYDLVFTTFRADQNVVTSSAGDESLHTVWTTALHLARPRVRLQRAAIYFTATLTLRPDAFAGHGHHNELLKDFESLPSNVLEPLQWDHSLSDPSIFLSESRITKVAPRSLYAQDAVKPIRGTSKRATPVIPAVFSRVRYSLIPGAVIASLHIEASKLVTGSVSIANAVFDVAKSQVKALTNEPWPVELQPGNELVMLYRLPAQERSTEISDQAPSSVFITIDASVFTEQESPTKIQVCWQTQVDLTLSYERPSYKWAGPLSAISPPSNQTPRETSPRPASGDVTSNKTTDSVPSTFTLAAPRTVCRGQIFKLTVNYNNRTHRTRRFGLSIVSFRKPRLQRSIEKNDAPIDPLTRVFSRPISGERRSPHALSLDAGVCIGPSLPGTCFQTAIKFRPTDMGLLKLGMLRVVDLDTRKTVHIKELQDQVVTDELISNR